MLGSAVIARRIANAEQQPDELSYVSAVEQRQEIAVNLHAIIVLFSNLWPTNGF